VPLRERNSCLDSRTRNVSETNPIATSITIESGWPENQRVYRLGVLTASQQSQLDCLVDGRQQVFSVMCPTWRLSIAPQKRARSRNFIPYRGALTRN